MNRGAWWATVHSIAKSWTPLRRLSKQAVTTQSFPAGPTLIPGASRNIYGWLPADPRSSFREHCSSKGIKPGICLTPLRMRLLRVAGVGRGASAGQLKAEKECGLGEVSPDPPVSRACSNVPWAGEEESAFNLQFHGAHGEGGAEQPTLEVESWPGVCLSLLNLSPWKDTSPQLTPQAPDKLSLWEEEDGKGSEAHVQSPALPLSPAWWALAHGPHSPWVWFLLPCHGDHHTELGRFKYPEVGRLWPGGGECRAGGCGSL